MLDFVNTVHSWTVDEPEDRLRTFREAVAFGQAAGMLTGAEARRLARRESASELAELRDLRGRLERVFRALIVGDAPPPADLDALARDGAEAARSVRLHPRAGSIRRDVDADLAGPATLRWRVVEAALALLATVDLARLKSCPECGWLFLDISKNRSRRWCSMEMCGAAAKARAYYHRKRKRS